MVIAVIFVVLAVVAAAAVMAANRSSRARPDQPRAGVEGPTNDVAGEQDGTWSADRPGDPGLEGMNPEHAGDPTAGPADGDDGTPHGDDAPHNDDMALDDRDDTTRG